jgi:hypothetical protein
MTEWPNQIAGVGAGCVPEFIEMMQVEVIHRSGSALGSLSNSTFYEN